MAQTTIRAPQFDSQELNTGDSLERGDSPKKIVEAIQAMMTELYSQDVLPTIPAAKLLRTRAGFGKVRAGAGNCIIACVGDSNTRGTGSGAGAGGSGGAQGYNGWPVQLAAYLKANGTNAVCENFFGGGGYDAAINANDDRITLGGTVTFGGTVGPGGAYFQMNAAGSVSFLTKTACNTADIYYVRGSGTGTIRWSVDGGATTNIVTTNGATTVGKTTIALGSVAVHTILIEWVSGSNFFAGIDAYDNTTNRVHVWNWGWHGSNSGVTNWTNTQSAYGPITAPAAFYLPDLIIGPALANDWNTTNNFSVATMKANLQVLINSWSVNSDMILLTPSPEGAATFPTLANQAPYIDGLFALALTNGLPILNEWAWMNNEAVMETLGIFNTDKIHKTKAGHNITANKVGRALLDWA